MFSLKMIRYVMITMARTENPSAVTIEQIR